MKKILLTVVFLMMMASHAEARHIDWDDGWRHHDRHFHHGRTYCDYYDGWSHRCYRNGAFYIISSPEPVVIRRNIYYMQEPQPQPVYVPQPAYAPQQEAYCREYSNMVNIGGRMRENYGTACRQPDGSWKIID